MGSLETLETQGNQMRLSAKAGSLSIVFPKEVREDLLANAPTFAEPTPEELEEPQRPKELLEAMRTRSPSAACSGVCCAATPASGTTWSCALWGSSP